MPTDRRSLKDEQFADLGTTPAERKLAGSTAYDLRIARESSPFAKKLQTTKLVARIRT
jgi:hypothetical protein